jgi:hypothetical protein
VGFGFSDKPKEVGEWASGPVWPDEFVKKSPKMWPNRFLSQN